MSKAINIFRKISIFLFLGVLGWIYALFENEVRLLPKPSDLTISRDLFFYLTIGIFLLINGLFLLIFKLGNNLFLGYGDDRIAWAKMIVPLVNVYLSLMIGSIGVLNNRSSFEPGAYAYLNYIGPFILMVWLLGVVYFFVYPHQKIIRK